MSKLNRFESLHLYIQSISLYRETAESPALRELERLCSLFGGDFDQVCRAWCGFYRALCEGDGQGSLPDYLFGRALQDENPFSALCAREGFLATPSHLRQAAKNDLSMLCVLSKASAKELKVLLFSAYGDRERVIDVLPEWTEEHKKYRAEGDWGDELVRLAEHYRENGCGFAAQCPVFCYTEEGELAPQPQSGPSRRETLAGLDGCYEKGQALFSLAPQGAMPRLLITGEEGAGKTTLAKTCWFECAQGTRLVWCRGEDVESLFAALGEMPARFLVLCDDITDAQSRAIAHYFTQVGALPENVSLAATAVSAEGLADAGIVFERVLPLQKLTQLEYLELLYKLAPLRGLDMSRDELKRRALEWELKQTAFTPQSAQRLLGTLLVEADG